ncbi:P-loop NTPase fold protein, partial [uncultured Streptococcus sp.]|uniref:P-loop NTPase fold protein n=1 Tax=uncultured Streptococcus sp. TaxID=83427 RepID=UPI00265EA2B0
MENYVEKINWEKFKKPIVIETVTLNEDSENYLFKNQLDSVKEMLNHFDKEKDSKGEVISRNISIAGERGSGKTSFLKSLKNILSKEYHVFDIIGPELLSSNLGITTIFLSMLNTLLEERSKDIDSNLNKFSIVKKQMKQATAAISVEKQQDDYFKNGNAESEILRALTDRVKLDEVMAKLLEEIKKLIKGEEKEKKDFVLIIDDLDLVKNSQVSQLLTEIQRYLDKKLIIIFAYRERQLENSLFENRFNDNKNLIGQKIIESDEIYSQIEQFLIKLVPYSNRIKLFNQDDVLNLEIDEVLNSLGTSEKKKYVLDNNLHIILHDKSSSDSKTGLTVEKWFYDYIHRHTDLYIKPVDTREDTHQFLPRSLRELIQCFEVFDKMILPTRDDGITIFL